MNPKVARLVPDLFSLNERVAYMGRSAPAPAVTPDPPKTPDSSLPPPVPVSALLLILTRLVQVATRILLDDSSRSDQCRVSESIGGSWLVY